MLYSLIVIEAKIRNIPAKDTKDPNVLYTRVSDILYHESEGLKYVPSELLPGLNAVRERFRARVADVGDPSESRSFSPVRASALYIDRAYRLPLLKLGKTIFERDSELFEDLASGIEHATGALLRAEDALIYGADEAVKRGLIEATEGMSPEDRERYIWDNFSFFKKVTKTQLEDFLIDHTGNYLLGREYGRLLMMNKGISPYEGVAVTPDSNSQYVFDGLWFASSAFSAIYPVAADKFKGTVI